MSDKPQQNSTDYPNDITNLSQLISYAQSTTTLVTNKDVATHCGISESTFSKLKNGAERTSATIAKYTYTIATKLLKEPCQTFQQFQTRFPQYYCKENERDIKSSIAAYFNKEKEAALKCNVDSLPLSEQLIDDSNEKSDIPSDTVSDADSSPSAHPNTHITDFPEISTGFQDVSPNIDSGFQELESSSHAIGSGNSYVSSNSVPTPKTSPSTENAISEPNAYKILEELFNPKKINIEERYTVETTKRYEHNKIFPYFLSPINNNRIYIYDVIDTPPYCVCIVFWDKDLYEKQMCELLNNFESKDAYIIFVCDEDDKEYIPSNEELSSKWFILSYSDNHFHLHSKGKNKDVYKFLKKYSLGVTKELNQIE